MPPRMKSTAATAKKPQKTWSEGTGSAQKASHAKPWKSKTMPKIAKTAAAPPTAAPLASRASFWLTSALASSISSRTSSEARSEISLTASAIALPLLWSSAGNALEDHGGEEAAGERGAPTSTSGRSAGVASTPAGAGATCRSGGRRGPGVGRRVDVGGSLGRFFPEDAPVNDGGDPRGQDARRRSDAREQAGPHQALDDVVVHGRNAIERGPRLRPARRRSSRPRTPWPASRSASPRGRKPKIQPVRTCSMAP